MRKRTKKFFLFVFFQICIDDDENDDDEKSDKQCNFFIKNWTNDKLVNLHATFVMRFVDMARFRT